MDKLLERNIKLVYLFRMIRSFLLIVPILVPYFKSHGLSQTDIYLLESTWALTIMLLEVPSGYFADVIGRRRSMLAGAFLSTTGFVIYSFAPFFSWMLLAQVLFGVGYSFISGADSALAFDSLKHLRREEGYKRFEGNSIAVMAISEAIASVLGGLLAVVSLDLPMFVQTFVYALLFLACFFVVEPPVERRKLGSPVRDVLKITAFALHGDKEIKWLILYGAVAGTLTHTMVWITQPYYELVGVPLAWFGVLWAIQLLALGVFARSADRFENALGSDRALFAVLVIGVLTYVVLGIAPSVYVLPAILAFYFVRGVHMPILLHRINARVESDVRATVMSVRNLMQKLLYAGLGPLVGYSVDAFSLETALLLSAVVYFALSVVVSLGILLSRK